MIILCDTSSIFLLLRIAPDMFIDPVYKCVTIPEVFNELFRYQKFKEKYPWRVEYKSKVKTLPWSQYKNSIFDKYHKLIKAMLDNGVIDEETGQLLNLSPVDQTLAACALAHTYEVSSGDGNLVKFMGQQFAGSFSGNLSALEVVNRWISEKTIIWDNEKQKIVEEWEKQREKPQPERAIEEFKRLTGRVYPGA